MPINFNRVTISLLIGISVTALAEPDEPISSFATNRIDMQYTPPAPDGETPGRFQLVSAVVQEDETPRNSLFRIDTSTGRVWRYQRWLYPFQTQDGRNTAMVEGWLVTSEDFFASMKGAKALAAEFATAAIFPKKTSLPLPHFGPPPLTNGPLRSRLPDYTPPSAPRSEQPEATQ
jgi:hypothetical protein